MCDAINLLLHSSILPSIHLRPMLVHVSMHIVHDHCAGDHLRKYWKKRNPQLRRIPMLVHVSMHIVHDHCAGDDNQCG